MANLNPEIPPLEETSADSMPVESAPEIEAPETEEEEPSHVIDPALAFIIIVAVMILGFGNMDPEVRYLIVWVTLTVVAVATIVLDHIDVVSARPQSRDLVVGIIFGALVGAPLLAIGGTQLKDLSSNLFGKADDPAVFQMMAFTMPLAETLFFRGALQSVRSLIFTGAAAGLWAILLFFPHLNIREFPIVAVVIGVCFVLISFLYSYLRERFGILTSWTCQITINLLLFFASRFVG